MNIIGRLWSLKSSRSARHRTRGQSLVEMALLMPLLLLMMLGVLEVGWALRGYLVLANANREATRFAARGRYLDFNQTTPETIGYPLVVSHTLDSLASSLPVDLAPSSDNGGIIVSHYVVDTGQPCIDMDACVCSGDAANFNADNAGNIADYRPNPYRGPGDAWDNTDTWRYNSRPGDLVSRLDDAALRTQLANENNVFNCNLYKKDPSMPWSINSVVVVELFYDQPQLLHLFNTQSILGRPIIPDPIPFYTQTTMRITADARTGGKKPGGQGCAVWPIALRDTTLSGQHPGDDLGQMDVWNGGGSGGFGWLRWPSATSAGNSNYLADSLTDATMSVDDFEDACPAPQPSDTVLNAGDCVWGNTGVSNSSAVIDAMNTIMSSYGGQIRVPVWDDFTDTGSNGYYHIVGFAWITIVDWHLPQNESGGWIHAQFDRWDNDGCPGNGH
jgi:hypothetical protein